MKDKEKKRKKKKILACPEESSNKEQGRIHAINRDKE